MIDTMRKSLEQWLASNFCPIIETTGTQVCELKYHLNGKKGKIAIAFSRYHTEQDPWQYIIEGAGLVLTVPSFWLGIPKELVIPYLEMYIDDYLDAYVYNSNNSGNTGSGSGINPGYCPTIPPCHPPKPPHNHPPKPPKPSGPPCIGNPGDGMYTIYQSPTGGFVDISGSGCISDGCNNDCEANIST